MATTRVRAAEIQPHMAVAPKKKVPKMDYILIYPGKWKHGYQNLRFASPVCFFEPHSYIGVLKNIGSSTGS